MSLYIHHGAQNALNQMQIHADQLCRCAAECARGACEKQSLYAGESHSALSACTPCMPERHRDMLRNASDIAARAHDA